MIEILFITFSWWQNLLHKVFFWIFQVLRLFVLFTTSQVSGKSQTLICYAKMSIQCLSSTLWKKPTLKNHQKMIRIRVNFLKGYHKKNFLYKIHFTDARLTGWTPGSVVNSFLKGHFIYLIDVNIRDTHFFTRYLKEVDTSCSFASKIFY